MIQRGDQVVIRMLADVKQTTIGPLIRRTIASETLIYTDGYDIYARLPEWGYGHETVCAAGSSLDNYGTSTVDPSGLLDISGIVTIEAGSTYNDEGTVKIEPGGSLILPSTSLTTSNTSTSVSSDETSGSSYGQPETFTVTDTPSPVDGAMPTGSIQFLVDGVDFDTPVNLVNGVARSGSIATLGTGTHTVTTIYSGDAVYPMNSDGSLSLSIIQAVLTVTAENEVIDNGDAVPALTATIAGFVNGDMPGVVGASPSLSTPTNAQGAAGVYPIAVGLGSLAADNYSFQLVDGTLTVHPKVVDVRVEWGRSRCRSWASPAISHLSTSLPSMSCSAMT